MDLGSKRTPLSRNAYGLPLLYSHTDRTSIQSCDRLRPTTSRSPMPGDHRTRPCWQGIVYAARLRRFALQGLNLGSIWLNSVDALQASLSYGWKRLSSAEQAPWCAGVEFTSRYISQAAGNFNDGGQVQPRMVLAARCRQATSRFGRLTRRRGTRSDGPRGAAARRRR
jgi:hypothetical protein